MMAKLLSLLFLLAVFVPNPIPSVKAGLTVYKAFPGKALGCSGRFYDESREWVALPTEWFLGGTVDCGDLVYTCLSNGH